MQQDRNCDSRRILIFLAYYLPGYKAGGPIRTISNLVDQLGGDFCFKIVTNDRDKDEDKSYANIVANKWVKVGKSLVYYMAPNAWTYLKILELIGREKDLLYI